MSKNIIKSFIYKGKLTTPNGVFESKHIPPLEILNDLDLVDKFKKSAFFNLIDSVYKHYNGRYPYTEMKVEFTEEDYYYSEISDSY